MNLDSILNKLWIDYIIQNPSAGKIHNLFIKEGEDVVNDHIAFRTLDVPEINIDILAKLFISNGYVPGGEYFFKDKHLYAKHFESERDENAPRIFISQLILPECSQFLQKTLTDALDKSDKSLYLSEALIFSGSIFNPLSFVINDILRIESDYAEWFYDFGFRAYLFTVSINSLKNSKNI